MTLNRYFQFADGTWAAAMFSTEGEFTVPLADHEQQIGESYGQPVTGVDAVDDPRKGQFIAQTPTPDPDPQPSLEDKVDALLAAQPAVAAALGITIKVKK